MKTKEEMIEAIYENIADGIYDSYSEDETIFPVMIWDVLDYIDKNLFKKEIEDWWFETDIKAREKSIITLYNYFIWNYRNPVEKLDNAGIEYIYSLIKD